MWLLVLYDPVEDRGNQQSGFSRINQAPTLGYEQDVGYRTTHHVMYPESAINLNNDSTSLLLVPFKTLDLEWLISAMTTGNITYTYMPVMSRIKANRNKVLVYNPAPFYEVRPLRRGWGRPWQIPVHRLPLAHLRSAHINVPTSGPDLTNAQSYPHSSVPTSVPELTNAQSNPHSNVPASGPDLTNAQSNSHSNVPASGPDLTNAQSDAHSNVPTSVYLTSLMAQFKILTSSVPTSVPDLTNAQSNPHSNVRIHQQPDLTNTQSFPHSSVPTSVPDFTNAQSKPHKQCSQHQYLTSLIYSNQILTSNVSNISRHDLTNAPIKSPQQRSKSETWFFSVVPLYYCQPFRFLAPVLESFCPVESCTGS
ncbi:hypothetical protein NFI96_031486 [Prochilodus magdalenae]|nr:hypothetical protein NFI96_031486 [Prochilodus magdalenae]